MISYGVNNEKNSKICPVETVIKYFVMPQRLEEKRVLSAWSVVKKVSRKDGYLNYIVKLIVVSCLILGEVIILTFSL